MTFRGDGVYVSVVAAREKQGTGIGMGEKEAN